MFKHLRRDIQAVLDRDPAARSALEVVLCYPSFKAVRRHRRAHWLWTHDLKLLARIVSQRTRRITGIEIHPGATIGNNVVVGSGAKVLGPFKVGDHSKIGAGAIVLKEVPPHCTVVGNPGRVVRMMGARVGIDLDQVNLPDPVKERILALESRLDELEKCVDCPRRTQDPDCAERADRVRKLKEELKNEAL